MLVAVLLLPAIFLLSQSAYSRFLLNNKQ